MKKYDGLRQRACFWPSGALAVPGINFRKGSRTQIIGL